MWRAREEGLLKQSRRAKMGYWVAAVKGGLKNHNQVSTAVGNKIYAIGQSSNSHGVENADQILSVHVLSTDELRWSKVEAKADKHCVYDRSCRSERATQLCGGLPVQRIGYTAVTFEGKIYMWGGWNIKFVVCCRVYCFDPATEVWSIIQSVNTAPARSYHSAVVYKDMMIVYGGIVHTSDHESSITQDFLVYKFYEKTWYTFNTRGGLPPGRVGHVACVINDKMYVFGGFNESGTYLPMIVIDLISYEWYRPFVRGTIPYGRKYHCIWVHKDKMYITGGYDVMSSKYFNNIYVYDPEKFIWAEMHTSGFEGPLQRRVHSTVIVGTHVYVLYGTMSYQPYGPLNQYTPEKQCGLHVLSLECNLKELAAVAVVRHNLHNLVPNVLPHELKSYLALITEPNSEF